VLEKQENQETSALCSEFMHFYLRKANIARLLDHALGNYAVILIIANLCGALILYSLPLCRCFIFTYPATPFIFFSLTLLRPYFIFIYPAPIEETMGSSIQARILLGRWIHTFSWCYQR